MLIHDGRWHMYIRTYMHAWVEEVRFGGSKRWHEKWPLLMLLQEWGSEKEMLSSSVHCTSCTRTTTLYVTAVVVPRPPPPPAILSEQASPRKKHSLLQFTFSLYFSPVLPAWLFNAPRLDRLEWMAAAPEAEAAAATPLDTSALLYTQHTFSTTVSYTLHVDRDRTREMSPATNETIRNTYRL